MKKILLLTVFLLSGITAFSQTTYKLELVAEGNFGSTNGDLFRRNTTVNPAANSTGIYQSANSTTGFNVLQDFVVAGNKAVMAEKPSGAGRLVVANYPSLTNIFTHTASVQTLGVASATKVYASYAQGGTVVLVDLVNNTLTPVTEPNNEITGYSNFMVFAHGFMFVQNSGNLVKIDTVTNTVAGVITVGVGTITGLMTNPAQDKLYVTGGSSLKTVDLLNGDAVSAAIPLGFTTKHSRYYNNKIYFWSSKKMYIYDIASGVTPTAEVYTSLLSGSWDFGYGRGFAIDPATGDFVITTANLFTSGSGFEVVDGTTFQVIESSSLPGCIGANKCSLQTFHTTPSTAPVPTVATLPDATGECSATLTAPTATGQSGTVTGTTTSPLNYEEQGTFTVTWTYTDAGGTSTQDQTVVIDDATNPVPDVANLPDVTASCEVLLTAPTATDNCTGTVTATTTSPLTYDEQGTYAVTWIYDDGNGNTISSVQQVIIEDEEAPQVTTLPQVTLACNASAAAPTAQDNCSGSVTATTTDAVSFTQSGTFTINWKFTDENENSVTVAQQVVVSCSTTGIEENSLLVSVYPVPANENVTIVFGEQIDGELRIVNLNGSEVRKVTVNNSETMIDVAELPDGLYFGLVNNRSFRLDIRH